MESILVYCFDCFIQPLQWFTDLLKNTYMYGVYMSAIVVFITYKFILSPIYGMAKSDTAKLASRAFKKSKRKE